MCDSAGRLATKRRPATSGVARSDEEAASCGRRVWAWFPVATALGALVPFYGLLAGDGRFISGSDYPAFYVPFHDFARDEALAGHFPLWMPYLTCGAPLHAEQHATLLYPPAAPFVLLLGANTGIKITLFFHVALCYAGQYLLARQLAISRPAASFAAISAVWGTFPMDQLAAGHITFVLGYALIPWFFWPLVRLLARPGAASAAALAAAVALLELGSHPQVLYYVLLGATCWTIGWFFSAGAAEARPRTLGWLAAAAACSMLLSAAQWVPAGELVRDGSGEAERGAASHAAMYSMDGSDLARMLVPRFKGDEPLGIEPFERGGYEHERGTYLGTIILPLAAFGLSRAGAARWQWGAAWLCLLAAEIALAEHSPLWDFFIATVPGLVWFRCQGRIFSVVAIVSALLGARGLDALVRGERAGARRSRWELLVLSIAAALVLGDSMRRWLARVDWHEYLRYASLHLRHEYLDLAAIAIAVAVVLYVCRAFGREFPRAVYLLPIVALMGDLYEYNVRHFQLVPPNGRWQVALPRGAPPNRFVFAPGDLHCTRISLQYSWAVPLAIGSRISAVNTNDGAVLPGAVSRLYAAIERNPRLALALAGCDWAYIESSGRWRELPGALPRLRFVRCHAAALCERHIGECGENEVQALRAAMAGTVGVRLEEPRRLEFDVDAPEDGMFVLADTYYPGWQATVDGEQAEIIAAHGVFRGVRVAAGEHRIVFSYDPWSFKIGCALSGCGLLGLVGLVWWAWRAKRRGAMSKQTRSVSEVQ